MNFFEKTLYDLRNDLVKAMQLKDVPAKTVIRQIIASLNNASIDKRRDLHNEEVIEVISREVKQYKEALDAARLSGRQDLIEKAETELYNAECYLPAQMEEDEVRLLITHIVQEKAAFDKAAFPDIMRLVMPRIKGRFDGKRAKELVEEAIYANR